MVRQTSERARAAAAVARIAFFLPFRRTGGRPRSLRPPPPSSHVFQPTWFSGLGPSPSPSLPLDQEWRERRHFGSSVVCLSVPPRGRGRRTRGAASMHTATAARPAGRSVSRERERESLRCFLPQPAFHHRHSSGDLRGAKSETAGRFFLFQLPIDTQERKRDGKTTSKGRPLRSCSPRRLRLQRRRRRPLS